MLKLRSTDRIAEKFFVNKIGTRSLALPASHIKIPVAVLAARNKLWPANLPFGQEPQHAREEVWADAPAKIKRHNVYFEEIKTLSE